MANQLIPGLGIEDLNPHDTIAGDELIEVSVPRILENGQKTFLSLHTTVNSILRLYSSRTDNPNSVTASQTGAYTTDEVNAIIESRFGSGVAALNALKLDGSSKQEIIDEARNGTVADSLKLGGELADRFAKSDDIHQLIDVMVDSFNHFEAGE